MKKYQKRLLRIISCCLFLSLCVSLFGANQVIAASKPAKPSFSVKKRTKTTATLKIKKKGKVSGYHVYIKSSKKGKYKIIPSISRTVKLKKLKKNKVYYVKIRAYRTKGIKITFGKFSKTVKIGKYKKTTTTSKTTVTETKKPSAVEIRAQKYAQEVLALVNKERAAAGLSAYTLDDTLCQAANIRAQEIVSEFSHTRPDGTSCFSVLQQFNYQHMKAGENIAAGQSTPEQVVDSWMHSEGHRANILSTDYTKMGVGYWESSTGYTYYWTQLFSD